MKTRSLIITTVTSYLLFVLLLIPASSVLSLVNLPANTVKLSGISGSIWSGNIDQLQVKNHSFTSVKWSLNLLSLFIANISTDINASYLQQEINTELSYSLLSKQVSLANVNSQINSADLQKQLNLPFGELEGTIYLDFDLIEIESGKLPYLSGQLQWKQAQLTLSDTISIGQLLLDINTNDDGQITGKLSNSSGDLSINGDLTISTNKKYSLKLRLTPRANASSELKSVLRLIAPQKDKADHIIRRNGQLQQLGIKL